MEIKSQKPSIAESLIKRPLPVILSLLLLSLSGFFVYHRLNVDILPNLNYPLVNIITHYPGASPSDIEILVTRPIESAVRSLKNVRRISSISAQGFSKVTVEFTWGLNVSQAQQEIISSLAKVKTSLPKGAEPVIENIGSSLQEIMGYVVESRKVNRRKLRNLAQYNIAPLLRAVEGVSEIDVYGGEKEAYIVDASPYSLGSYNIGLSEIANKIKSSNLQVHVGFLDKYHQDFPLRGICKINGTDDLKNVLIRYNPPHPPLILAKLARIFKGSLPQRYAVYTDNVPGVVFSVYKQPNASTIQVAKEIKRQLAKIRKNLPGTIEIKPYYDQSELIEHQAHNLTFSIILGAFLVVGVLMVLLNDFLGGLIIAFTIPLIVSASLLFLYLFGFSLNVITLGGFAVAVGMLVDGSIIVLENIYRRRQMGKDRISAAVEGTKEIMGPDISGVLTTVAVFLPLLLLSGIGGKLFFPFGFTVSVVLICSLIFSLTFIPVLMGARKKIKKGKINSGDKFFSFLRDINKKILRRVLKRPKTSIAITILFLIILVLLLSFSPLGFMPQVDEGAILCEYILPPGTSFKESKKIGAELEKTISKVPDVTTTYLRVGSAEESYQVEGVNRGEILAKLAEGAKRKRTIKEIIRQMKTKIEKFKGVETFFHQPTMEKIDESFSGLPAVFALTIYGDDYNKLSKYSSKIEKTAKRCPLIENVVNNAVIKIPETQIKLRKDKMNSLGLNPENVLKELAIAMKGKIVSETVKGERSIPIFLTSGKFPPSKKNVDDLKNIPLKIPGGGVVNLSDIAYIKDAYTINQLNHIDMKREITLNLEIEGGIGRVVNWFKKNLPNLHMPPGYFIEFTGQYKSLVKAVKGLIFSAVIAIIIVYLIMTIQFNSALQPLAILFELPLSFIGGCFALIITRQPINLSSLIGFLTLIGISVNNGIILIDYANRMRRAGMERQSALEESANVRVRPIFLTTITTVFGLLPVALSSGVHKPLAIVVIGGLLVSSFLTLNILPAIYCVLEDWRKYFLRKT